MTRVSRKLFLLAAVALLPACESNSGGPDAAVKDYLDSIKDRLPAGWAIARGSEVTFKMLPPSGPDSIIVYKTQPVPLQDVRASAVIDATGAGRDSATTQKDTTGHIYFTLTRHDFIDPEKFAEQFKANEKIRRDHQRVLGQISNVPRNEKGEPVPRGNAETVEVNAVMAEYKKLPPFVEHMPTHYYDDAAFKLHDWRVQLVPVDRELQQEMNTVYALMIERLKRYPTR